MKTIGKNLIIAALLAGGGLPVWAGSFIPGNLVVDQVGDGTAPLTNTAAPIVLNEFTPAGTLVQSIALPSTGAGALVNMGYTNLEGLVTRSGNGQYLILAGYNTAAGTAVFNSKAGAVPRAIGFVDASGDFTLGPVSLTNYSQGEICSATSDGYGNFWSEGMGGATGAQGVCYQGQSKPVSLSTYPAHVIKEIGGNLYFSFVQGQSISIAEIPGVPITNYPVLTTLNILNIYGKFRYLYGNPLGFVFDPTMTEAYVAESHAYTNSATLGGVEKWTNSPATGTWGYAYTLAYGTNGAAGLEADFNQANPVIYGTSADGKSLFSIVDTGASSTGTLLATAAPNTAFRGVAFAPTNGPSLPAVTILTPASTNIAIFANYSINAYIYAAGPMTCAWYFETATATNLIAGATNADLTLTNLALANTGNYQLAVTDATGNSVTSAVVSLTVYVVPPTISGLYSASAPVGQNAYFSPTYTGSSNTTFSYQWYFEPAAAFAKVYTPSNYSGPLYYSPVTATNPISWATRNAMTLTNVSGLNEGNYFVVVSDAWGISTTSTPAALLVTGDPGIQVQPSDAQGVVGGQVRFVVNANGTPPVSCQWYFSDANGKVVGPATSLGDGSVLSTNSATNTVTSFTSVLTLANLQPNSLTNFVAVVTGPYGTATSSVASTVTGIYSTTLPATQGVLALWDFDGPVYNPESVPVYLPTYLGAGSCSLISGNPSPVSANLAYVDPFDQGEDPGGDGWVYTPYGFEQPSPNESLGISGFLITQTGGISQAAGNKVAGVQFMVSTVGARNIIINFDERVLNGGSDYQRLQYTIDGTNWIDYPASICFDDQNASGTDGGFYPFSFDLTGFPGVDNNPQFGFRVVMEYESTATYGVVLYNNLVGDGGFGQPNSFNGNASVCWDIVAVLGDSITNSFTPPVLGSFVNTNMIVTNTLNIPFTASDAWMPASGLTFTVQYLDSQSPYGPETAYWGPNYTVTQTGPTNFVLQLSFSPGGTIPDAVDATPVVITATDTNGQSAVAWFDLTVNPTPISYLAFVGAPTFRYDAVDAVTNMTFVAANIGGGFEYLLASTNLAAPLDQWVPIWTNGLPWTNAPGTTMYTTNMIEANSYKSTPQRYFRLSTQN